MGVAPPRLVSSHLGKQSIYLNYISHHSNERLFFFLNASLELVLEPLAHSFEYI